MPTTITTDNADLLSHHVTKTETLPKFYQDQLSGRIVADIPSNSQISFLNDATIQKFLTAKKTVWRAISELRNRGGRRD
jgi:hypothetical protein